MKVGVGRRHCKRIACRGIRRSRKVAALWPVWTLKHRHVALAWPVPPGGLVKTGTRHQHRLVIRYVQLVQILRTGDQLLVIQAHERAMSFAVIPVGQRSIDEFFNLEKFLIND